MAESLASVQVRRRLSAGPEAVFRAFTEPRLLSRWFSPSADIATRVLELDLRPGGRYRFAFRFPDGAEAIVRGEFLEIQRPGSLVFTWTWEEPDPHAGIETKVSVVLSATGNGTELVVTHERFPEESVRNRHDEGWSTTLDRLEMLLSERDLDRS